MIQTSMCQRNFMQLLQAKWLEGKMLCVGLDTDFSKISPADRVNEPGMDDLDIRETMFNFNKAIVRSTAGTVCTYKLNSAFYEAEGAPGIQAMYDTVDFIHRVDPTIPVILDAKRADIGNTNKGYASAAFEVCNADGLTLHPYLGREALSPFLDMENKGFFILCRTSNLGAGEFQDLDCNGRPLYQIVAEQVAKHWNTLGNCGLVVGATYPEELAIVRSIVGDDMPILIPGIGAQGGDVKATVDAGVNSTGRGILVNSSRGIIFAKQRQPEKYKDVSFAEAAHLEAVKAHNQIVESLF